jgi:hypothetical protein
MKKTKFVHIRGVGQLDDDVRDLLKTIQIQLCMKQNELSP